MGAKKGIRNWDVLGKKYGALTVFDLRIINGTTRAICQCYCGRGRICEPKYLRNNPKDRCGCDIARYACLSSKNKKVHGMSNTRVYRIWENMKQRCLNKNFKKYRDYGGRGISICDEWLTFINFNNWAINNGYEDGLTIDRKENLGNYTPENCRWITNLEQQSNTRKTVRLTYNGETHHVSEWARIIGVERSVILYRIKVGKPIEEILKPK